jgi:hypothetical protein
MKAMSLGIYVTQRGPVMITNSTFDVFYFRLSAETELRLVLLLFLFPAIRGAALAVVAFFQDLKGALSKGKAPGRSASKLT